MNPTAGRRHLENCHWYISRLHPSAAPTLGPCESSHCERELWDTHLEAGHLWVQTVELITTASPQVHQFTSSCIHYDLTCIQCNTVINALRPPCTFQFAIRFVWTDSNWKLRRSTSWRVEDLSGMHSLSAWPKVNLSTLDFQACTTSESSCMLKGARHLLKFFAVFALYRLNRVRFADHSLWVSFIFWDTQATRMLV
jgi:hypothetical protein